VSLSSRKLTLAAVAVGAAVTLATVFLPFVKFAYSNPEAHIALDSAAAVMALVAAYLVFGRLRQDRLLREALIVYGLVLLATTNISLSVLPTAVFGSGPAELGWGTLLARFAAAIALALASLTQQRKVRVSERILPWLLTTAAVGTVAAISLGMTAFGSKLPFGVREVVDLSISDKPVLEGHPVLLLAQLALVLIFAIASIRFTAQADRTGEALLRWLGVATALAAFSMLNYFLFPSVFTGFIYTGDLTLLGFYLCLLVGASAEVRRYWRRLEEDRLERERLIGELQELSLVDPLTGLSNRRGFFNVADQELILHERSERALHGVFIDVDEMKTINDGFGHHAGDDALREVAEMLRSSFRRSDLIARIGGDEFCVLTIQGGPQLAIERVRAALAARRPSESAPYPLELSIGVARFDPAHHSSIQELLDEADRNMYEEKTAHSQGSRATPGPSPGEQDH